MLVLFNEFCLFLLRAAFQPPDGRAVFLFFFEDRLEGTLPSVLNSGSIPRLAVARGASENELFDSSQRVNGCMQRVFVIFIDREWADYDPIGAGLRQRLEASRPLNGRANERH
jgi:hypothetical protein